MGAQKEMLAAGAAVGATSLLLKKQKLPVGQKRQKENRQMVKSDNPANISLSQLAAERAKQSLQEHREAKRRSKGKFGKKNKPVEGEKA